MIRYLLDTNIFIHAKNDYFRFDYCMAFWNWLIQENQAGKVASVKMVATELLRKQDQLQKWVKARGKGFFLVPDKAVFSAGTTVSELVVKRYPPEVAADFLKKADYWIISHALAHKYTVVTHEVPSNTTKTIKIPTICKALDIEYTNTYEMLSREGANFILGPNR